MSTARYLALPVDSTSRERLAADGLRLDRLDLTDRAAFGAWQQAVARGFMDSVLTDERIDQRLGYSASRRLIGVFDSTTVDESSPVGTVESWIADLTVPGGAAIPAWAISGVTVAPTHRRRGIARALLEAELRTASTLGLPIAILTVSESTIYRRFGFAPAAMVHDLTIDTRRATWTGPQAAGRVHFVTAEQLRVDGHEIVERVRLDTPGQVEYSGVLWDRQLGLLTCDESAKSLRFVRYDDASGHPQGFAIYTVTENESDWTQSTLMLSNLVAATPDAYAGLWRFLLEIDLIATVKAYLRPVHEPLRWMISDFRAVHTSETDHLWTRILDVRASLEARTYATSGRIVLGVDDPYGFAAGTWALEVDPSGHATVTPTEDDAEVTLSVAELSALHLGGVSALTMAAAGGMTGDVARLDAMFRSPVAPYLSIWF